MKTIRSLKPIQSLRPSFRILAFHGLVGSLIGYLLLHPASVFVHLSFDRHSFSIKAFLFESFSLLHLPMALYFLMIGMVIGIGYGIYHTKVSQLYEEVRILSVTDPLTSLYNRRYLVERLKDEVDRCNRYGRSLSFMMADIDHFKKYNDTYGHQRGDELLKMVAGEFRHLMRKLDFVARYGGEEFAVVMPETGFQEALHLAERIRESIRMLSVPGDKSLQGERITVSIGIAELPIHATDMESLIREADRALYRAKNEGRDRVIGRGNRGD